MWLLSSDKQILAIGYIFIYYLTERCNRATLYIVLFLGRLIKKQFAFSMLRSKISWAPRLLLMEPLGLVFTATLTISAEKKKQKTSFRRRDGKELFFLAGYVNDAFWKCRMLEVYSSLNLTKSLSVLSSHLWNKDTYKRNAAEPAARMDGWMDGWMPVQTLWCDSELFWICSFTVDGCQCLSTTCSDSHMVRIW